MYGYRLLADRVGVGEREGGVPYTVAFFGLVGRDSQPVCFTGFGGRHGFLFVTYGSGSCHGEAERSGAVGISGHFVIVGRCIGVGCIQVGRHIGAGFVESNVGIEYGCVVVGTDGDTAGRGPVYYIEGTIYVTQGHVGDTQAIAVVGVDGDVFALVASFRGTYDRHVVGNRYLAGVDRALVGSFQDQVAFVGCQGRVDVDRAFGNALVGTCQFLEVHRFVLLCDQCGGSEVCFIHRSDRCAP